MRSIASIAALWAALALAAPATLAQECDESFDSTFELIQKAIFERNGCTSVTCHTGAVPAGGLDLTAEAAYDELVDAAVESIAAPETMRRVVPAKKEESLLWLNVAAASQPEDWRAPLRPMPIGFPALTFAELEVIRLWIESGAPEEGVVEDTGELLDACLPPTKPLQTRPLDPPPAGVGVQFKAPTQILQPRSEHEVCFLTYYDIRDQVPEQFRGPGGDTFRYKRLEARQDPLSHHAVVVNYEGSTPLTSPVWGSWTCGGGARHGEACEPTDLDSCGDDGVCHSTPQSAVGCIGFGDGRADIGFGNESLFNTMAAGLGGLEGVYAETPMQGVLIWNSHAFNVTDEPGKLDIWVNLYFADEEEQEHELQRFTVIDAMFGIDVPPFQAREMCSHYAVPPDTKIIELSSHHHKRGVRFRIFEGAFRCQGGSNNGAACSPRGDDDDLGAPDVCSGAPCVAPEPPAAGDCNGDLEVRIDELVTAVGVALGNNPAARCAEADADGSGKVSISELITAVRALLEPSMRDGVASNIYTSLFYSDPAVLKFDPPYVLGGANTSAAKRTLTYCGLYENGVIDPASVKRRSTAPAPPPGFPLGACTRPVACAEGNIGVACTVDADCDTATGADDGECDACSVRFGPTTDDEMFILLGAGFR